MSDIEMEAAEAQVRRRFRLIAQGYEAILIRIMAKLEVAEALASRKVAAASTRKDGAGPSKVTYAHMAARRDTSGSENAMPPPSKSFARRRRSRSRSKRQSSR